MELINGLICRFVGICGLSGARCGASIRPKSSGQRRCSIVSRGNSESKVARSDSYVAVAFYSVHNSSPSFAWLRRVAGETSREPLSSRNCDATVPRLDRVGSKD